MSLDVFILRANDKERSYLTRYLNISTKYGISIT